MYYGDIRLGDTIDIKFTSRTFTTGAPGTLSSSPVISAYPGNSTTELTAGITLSVDFDSRTGLNNVRVVATTANGYATLTNYMLVITTGTVGGVSVVGECVGSFSVECRSGDMAQVLPTAPAANTIGEALFMADQLGGRFGTAQAGAASTITLDAGASAVDGRYVGYGVYLYGGTGGGVRGVGQERTIVAYNGTTKVATLAQAWGTNPDNTSKFMLIVRPFANVGIWNGTVVSTPATAGIPDVNAKNWNNLATVALPLTPATAGRTLVVDAAGLADANAVKVGPSGSGTAQTARDIGASVLVAGDFSATMKTSIGTAVAASPVASVTGAVGSVTGLTASDVGAIKAKTDNLTATPADETLIISATNAIMSRLGAPAGASVSADVAAVKGDTGAVKTQTDKLAFTITNQVDANVIDWKSTTAPAMTGDAFARLGAPSGSSVSTDIAAVLAKTPDSVHFTAARGDKLDDLDATVSSRLATGGYTAPDNTSVAAVKTVTDKLATAIELNTGNYRFTTAALAEAPIGTGSTDVNVVSIAGNTNAATNLERGCIGTVLGTVGTGSTTTSIVTSALDPAASVIDQFKGRIVTFDRATTTVNLRGQTTDVTSSSSGGVLAVSALSTAPVSSDTFTLT